jgi:hypothetical protein
MILAGISLLLVLAVFIVYWQGPQMRQRSPFAVQINKERQQNAEERDIQEARIQEEKNYSPTETSEGKLSRPQMLRAESMMRLQQAKRVSEAMGCKQVSPANSHHELV